ncbi:GntR family transcriptional regulator [Faecalibaculum rodentium]|uniref:GntR family transcriptional regulator n=1 Tax=Faecalibaculum rodentium TaxID=1702221 RepID=UPI0026115D7B|nr:GntR family transcriptional regulator [Faecalibaculum rodentium]
MSQPKYIQVMDFLREDIAGRDPHTPILSEREISQRLDISRMTVRKAIEELCRQGVLYRGGNRGTFVARRPASVTVSGSAPRQERQRVLFLDSVYESANVRDVQKAFGLEDHQRLFRMVRLILDDDLPLRVEEIYALPEVAMDKGLNELESFFQLDQIRSSGQSRWDLHAALIPPKYSRLLEVRQGTPVICRRDQIRQSDGSLFLYINTWLHPDNVRITSSTMPFAAPVHT